MQRYPRKSRAQWLEIVRSFSCSQESIETFCQNHGVSVPSLRKWKRKLSNQANHQPAPETPSSFIPVTSTERRIATSPSNMDAIDKKPTLSRLRVIFSDGAILEWDAGASVDHVVSALAVLR